MSRSWGPDDAPRRVPRPRDPEGRLIRPALPGKPRTTLAAKAVYIVGGVILVLLAVALTRGYLANRDASSPRHSCELRGGVYSTDLQACLRMPR